MDVHVEEAKEVQRKLTLGEELGRLRIEVGRLKTALETSEAARLELEEEVATLQRYVGVLEGRLEEQDAARAAWAASAVRT